MEIIYASLYSNFTTYLLTECDHCDHSKVTNFLHLWKQNGWYQMYGAPITQSIANSDENEFCIMFQHLYGYNELLRYQKIHKQHNHHQNIWLKKVYILLDSISKGNRICLIMYHNTLPLSVTTERDVHLLIHQANSIFPGWFNINLSEHDSGLKQLLSSFQHIKEGTDHTVKSSTNIPTAFMYNCGYIKFQKFLKESPITISHSMNI